LSKIEKNLLYIQAACVRHVESFLESKHKKLKGLLEEARKMADDEEYDPCLRFLYGLQLERKTSGPITETTVFSSELNQYQDSVEAVANTVYSLDNVFPRPRFDMFTIVTCRSDGTRLRLPENKHRLIVKCPRCKYRFFADTSIPSFKRQRRIKKGSLLKRIFRPLLRK